MKKIKFEGKLNLNKEVVSRLNDNQMNDMKGGAFVIAITSIGKNCTSKKIKCTQPDPTFVPSVCFYCTTGTIIGDTTPQD